MVKDNVINPHIASTTMDVAEGSKHKAEYISIKEREDQHTTSKGNTSYHKNGMEMKIPPPRKC